MKTFLNVLIGLTVFFAALYFADQYNKQHTHPTLNETAALPDEYLTDMVIFSQRGEKKQCLSKIEKTIEALWVIEKDVDDDGSVRIEKAVIKLENLHKKVIIDSAKSEQIKATYRDVLSILGSLELQVAINLSKAEDFANAKAALGYAIQHFKNSQLFTSTGEGDQRFELVMEKICSQIEEFMKVDEISSRQIIVLDDLMSDIDELI